MVLLEQRLTEQDEMNSYLCAFQLLELSHSEDILLFILAKYLFWLKSLIPKIFSTHCLFDHMSSIFRRNYDLSLMLLMANDNPP